MTKLLPLLRLV